MHRPLAALFVLLLTAALPRITAVRGEPLNAVATIRSERLDAVDLNGRRWTIETLRGRVVLLDFWATWCAPCLAEMPRLQDLRRTYSRDDFEILGISLDVKDRRSLVSWLNRNRVDWPQVHERAGYGGDLPRLFGVDQLPRTVLFGRNGTVVATDLRGDRLAAAVARLLDRTENPVSAEGR